MHRVLESYSFRLTTRREILRLFTIQARIRQSASVSSVASPPTVASSTQNESTEIKEISIETN